MLVLCPRSDLAGSGIAIKRAFRHSDFEVRQVRRIARGYDYPHDAEWDDREALIEWADLVHVMELPGAIPSGKRSVLHHHGSYARSHLRELRQVRTTHICSTLDLHLLGLGEWIPSAYDIDSLAQHRQPSDMLTIAHAPTDRVSKSTRPFIQACQRLAKEVPLRVVLIEGVTHAECLRLKGAADIYFDQVLTGYGNNAVEAWGMGIPVIAGIEPREARKRGHLIPDQTPDEMARRFGQLPFVRADEGSIYDALRLMAEPTERAKWADIGLSHVRRFHDERVVVRKLEDTYRRALS